MGALNGHFLWHSVQMPDAVDKLSAEPDAPLLELCEGALPCEVGLLEVEAAPELLVPVAPFVLLGTPWISSLRFPPCAEELAELLELEAVPFCAWVCVVLPLPFPLVSGAIWFTAMAPKASAPTAATACTPVLMARRRDGS